MLELPDIYLVSNGDQTRTLADSLANGGAFEEALATRQREDDAPYYTPRISGLLDVRGGVHGVEPRPALSILRANDADPARTDHTTFRPAPPPPRLRPLHHHLPPRTAPPCRPSAATPSGCRCPATPPPSSTATGPPSTLTTALPLR